MLNLVELLLEDSRIDPSKPDSSSLIIASENGNIDIVELLLQDPRVDPDAKNGLALKLAVVNMNDEVVDLLLRDGRANPTYNGNELVYNAIEAAMRSEKYDTVKVLLEDPRIDPSRNRNYAAGIAYQHLDVRLLALLLANENVKKTINPHTRRVYEGILGG